MDNSIFEAMFSDRLVTKIGTEQCLTNYYKNKGFNIFKSAEFAENNIVNFVEFANKSIIEAQSQNVPYIFSFITKDVVNINVDYFPIRKLHENLLKIKEWRDFEFISTFILEVCFGAVDVKTTQASADGGLDFEGKIPIKSKLSNQTYGYIEVYGQSKKYGSSVGIYDIKSFVAFANSKKRNYVHPAQLFMFFTTSQFVPNAVKEIDVNGFLGFSGFQLASLIYYHKDLLLEKSELFIPLLENVN